MEWCSSSSNFGFDGARRSGSLLGRVDVPLANATDRLPHTINTGRNSRFHTRLGLQPVTILAASDVLSRDHDRVLVENRGHDGLTTVTLGTAVLVVGSRGIGLLSLRCRCGFLRSLDVG
jgi:hypothetical protein